MHSVSHLSYKTSVKLNMLFCPVKNTTDLHEFIKLVRTHGHDINKWTCPGKIGRLVVLIYCTRKKIFLVFRCGFKISLPSNCGSDVQCLSVVMVLSVGFWGLTRRLSVITRRRVYSSGHDDWHAGTDKGRLVEKVGTNNELSDAALLRLRSGARRCRAERGTHWLWGGPMQYDLHVPISRISGR